jgi:cytidine deaminase
MLSPEQKNRLVKAAAEARQLAYAPYSNYRVGAALLDKEGRIYTGVNVENAAYPTSICAERSAVFSAVSSGARQFNAIAVVTSNAGTPCGSCRQVLSEFGLDILVLVADEQAEIVQSLTVRDLLPHSFGPGDLNI